VLTCPRLITAWSQSGAQNHDLVDLRASWPLLPVPVAPVDAVCLQSRPAPLAQRLPPGFPRAAKCYFCGPPNSHVRGVDRPASAECRLPAPCPPAGLWAQEGRELEQDAGFRGAHPGGRGLLDREGANKRTLRRPETEGGLGSVQTHGAGAGVPVWRCLFPTCEACAAQRDAGLWKEPSVREIWIPDPVLPLRLQGVLLGAVRPLGRALPGLPEPEAKGEVSKPGPFCLQGGCLYIMDVFTFIFKNFALKYLP